MIASAFFATTVIMMVLALYLLQECQFLIPYRSLILSKYGPAIAVYAAALFLNLFVLFCAVSRKLFLKDTGKKLAHMEKQLRTGPSILDELSERLKD